MKKLLISIGLTFLFSSVTNAAGFLYGEKANEIYEEIAVLQNDLGNLTAECESLAVLMEAKFRLNLLDSNFRHLFLDYQRNKCLMQDVTSLEKALEEVVRLAPLSENVCSNDWQTYMTESVDNIRDEIYCLREYGEIKTEEKENYKEIKCANGLATDFIQNYNDGNCKDKSWNEVFKKVTKSWNKLTTKFSSTDESAKEIGGDKKDTFSIDQKAIDQAAKQNAQAWLDKNFSANISSKRLKIGIDWSGKTPNQLKEITEGFSDLTKKIVEKSFLDLWKDQQYEWRWAEKSTIISEYKHLENQEEFSKKLAESQTLVDIHSELDQEFFNGLEAADGIKGIFDKLTNDLNDLSGKKTNGNEDNLVTKKEALESLLNKQD